MSRKAPAWISARRAGRDWGGTDHNARHRRLYEHAFRGGQRIAEDESRARALENVFKSSTVKNIVLRSSGSRLSLKPSAPSAATKEDTEAAPFFAVESRANLGDP